MVIKRLLYSSSIPGIRFLSVFILTIFLTKEITVEDYGLWSLFISISGLAITIGSFNLMYSTQILLNDIKDENKSRVISSVFIFKFIATMVLSIIINIYFFYSGVFDSDIFFIATFFILFRVCTDFFFGILRALLMIRQQFIIFTIENISTALLVAMYLQFNEIYSLKSILLLAVASQILSAVYGYFSVRKFISIRESKIQAIKPFISLGFFLIPFSYLDLIIASFTPFIIQIYLGLQKVAIYSLAQKIALIVTIPGSILSNIYIQSYKKSLADKNKDMQKQLMYLLYTFIIITVLFGLVIIYLSEEIILLISNPEYLDSMSVLYLLVLCNILVVFNSFINYFLILKNEEKFMFYLWLVMLGLYFPFSIFFITIYGIEGAIYSILMISSIGLISSIAKYKYLGTYKK